MRQGGTWETPHGIWAGWHGVLYIRFQSIYVLMISFAIYPWQYLLNYQSKVMVWPGVECVDELLCGYPRDKRSIEGFRTLMHYANIRIFKAES